MSPRGAAALVRNESLRRGLVVLRVLVRAGEPISAAEVARRTEIPGPTVSRLLATLADEAMAARDAQGRWRPGSGVAELAGVDAGLAAVVARAADVLRGLANDTGESALLTRVQLPDHAETLAQEDSDHLLGATRWVGRVFDLRRSVAGWVVAAALDDTAVEALAGPEGDGVAERWLADVRTARKRGYGLDVDGLEAGLTSLAVHVPGEIAGLAVGLAGPSARLTPARAARVVGRMRAAAEALASFTE